MHAQEQEVWVLKEYERLKLCIRQSGSWGIHASPFFTLSMNAGKPDRRPSMDNHRHSEKTIIYAIPRIIQGIHRQNSNMMRSAVALSRVKMYNMYQKISNTAA